jgi:hypothetical protein
MFTYRHATGRDRSIGPRYPGSALLAILLTGAFIPVEAQTAPVLSRVNKIYVERLGHGTLGDQFPERVMAQLRIAEIAARHYRSRSFAGEEICRNEQKEQH